MKVNKWFVGDVAGALAGGWLALLVCTAVSAVFLRYILQNPLAWAEEVEVLMLLWIIMIGAVYAKRKNTLLRMDILYGLLPPPWRKLVDIVQECIHILVFSLMIFYGYKLALQVGAKTLPLLGVPLFWMYLSLPVGAAGMLLISLIQLYGQLSGREDS